MEKTGIYKGFGSMDENNHKFFIDFIDFHLIMKALSYLRDLLGGILEQKEDLEQKEEKGDMKVYCQKCNAELTEQGGDITNTGDIYCNLTEPKRRCVPASRYKEIRFYSKDRLKAAISEGVLRHYSTLDDKVR